MSGMQHVPAPLATPPPPPDTATLYAAIATWEASKTALAAAKLAESVARAKLAELAFSVGGIPPDSGTHYIPLYNGWRLKGEFKLNVTVNAPGVPDMLLKLGEQGEAGMHAAETVLRYKPELVAIAYKNLMPSIQRIVDTVLTTSPASPVFTLVPPKEAAAAKPATN